MTRFDSVDHWFGQAVQFGEEDEQRVLAMQGEPRVARPSNSVSLSVQPHCWVMREIGRRTDPEEQI